MVIPSPSIVVEESYASDHSMSSSSIVLPTAPEEERQSLLSGRSNQRHTAASTHYSTAAPMSPSTMKSSPPSSPTWSVTDDASVWEDARPNASEARSVLSRRDSQEFILVDDESDGGF